MVGKAVSLLARLFAVSGAIGALVSTLAADAACSNTLHRPANNRVVQNTALSQPPNLVILLADDLGYGDLGCFGQDRIRTPQLDRMAAEGLRFTQFYAGSTVCAPSRCSLLTGLHCGHARIRGNSRQALEDEDVTLAEELRDRGLRTALIGKWGLGEEGSGGVPTRQGFDSFYGYLNQVHAHNYYPEFLWRGEEREPLRNVVRTVGSGLGGVATERVDYSHDLFVAEALRFLDAQDAQTPFFLTVAFTIPHANNEARDQGMEVPDLGDYQDAPWPPAQRAHAAMIQRLDRDVGRLLQRLKERGLEEHTLVLFSSDNGPHSEGGADSEFFDSNGPLRGKKRDLYEGGIRVPTLARWPGRVPVGECDIPLAFWDVLPTFCELAGAPCDRDIDGISFAAALRGEFAQQARHDVLYWAFFENGGAQAVRFDRFKAIARPPFGPLELYDVVSDPGETVDLAEDHPELVERARDWFELEWTPSPQWILPGEQSPR